MHASRVLNFCHVEKKLDNKVSDNRVLCHHTSAIVGFVGLDALSDVLLPSGGAESAPETDQTAATMYRSMDGRWH